MSGNALFTFLCAAVLVFSSPMAFAQSCDTDADCDDGLYCNGRDYCFLNTTCRHVPLSRPCLFTGQVCDESADRCLTPCDSDGDCLETEICNGAVCIPAMCPDDSYCDDGLFCNGNEVCLPDHGQADSAGCVRPNPPCLEGQICLEDEDTCISSCPNPDEDGDGYDARRCGGSDCDDTTSRRNPGNPEVCDPDNVDEDCDPNTFGDRDADGDGFIDDRCCNEWDGELICGNDCSDSLRIMHPLGFEICDGRDNNCNGAIDDGIVGTRYPDNDGDGFGDANASPRSVGLCDGAPGFSANNFDCADDNPAIVPGAMICAGDGSTAVLICGSDGFYLKAECPEGTCVTMPNGLGTCQSCACGE